MKKIAIFFFLNKKLIVLSSSFTLLWILFQAILEINIPSVVNILISPFIVHFFLCSMILIFYRFYNKEFKKAFLVWLFNFLGVGYFYYKLIEELSGEESFDSPSKTKKVKPTPNSKVTKLTILFYCYPILTLILSMVLVQIDSFVQLDKKISETILFIILCVTLLPYVLSPLLLIYTVFKKEKHKPSIIIHSFFSVLSAIYWLS